MLAVTVLVIACVPLGCGSGSGPETASDDSGAISIDLPGNWDVDGAAAELPEIPDVDFGAGSPNASLLASSDLEQCRGTSFDVPCMKLVASTKIAPALGTDFATRFPTVLNVFASLSDRGALYEECADRGSALLENARDDNPTQALGGTYEGVVDIYTDCGEDGSTVYEFASFASEGQLFLMGLLAAPTDADGAELRSALETLEIDRELVPR